MDTNTYIYVTIKSIFVSIRKRVAKYPFILSVKIH